MSEEWFYEPSRYNDYELSEFIYGLEEQLTANHHYISELEQANKSMLTLIHLNDQKAALMEASPEFAEAMTKLEQTTPSP